MSVYQEIGGGYTFMPMRSGGLMVRAPNGWEIFIQPGDAESAMRENITALDEISEERYRRQARHYHRHAFRGVFRMKTLSELQRHWFEASDRWAPI